MGENTNQLGYMKSVIKDCIEEGRKLEKLLNKEYENSLEKADKEVENEFAKQEATSEFYVYYDESRDGWLKSVDKELKNIIEDYKWEKIFSKDSDSIKDYLNDLHNLKDRLTDPSTNEQAQVKELAISLPGHFLRNNLTGGRSGLGKTQVYYFIKILIEAKDPFISMVDFIVEFEKVVSKKTKKECSDLKSDFIEKLKKLNISEEVRENIITPGDGFTFHREYSDVIT